MRCLNAQHIARTIALFFFLQKIYSFSVFAAEDHKSKKLRHLSGNLPAPTPPVDSLPAPTPPVDSLPAPTPSVDTLASITNDDACLDVPVDWVDSFGDGCDWYAISDRCRRFGGFEENFGVTANQACCACGGGNQLQNGMISNFSWLGVDGCSASHPCGLCEGDCDSSLDCAEGLECFQRIDFTPVPGCSGSEEYGGDYCYNASSIPDPTLFPTPSQSTPSPTPLSATNNTCVDSPVHWEDLYGDGCDWYAVGDRCASDGDCCEFFGFTANQVCCVCGGGQQLEYEGDLSWRGFDGCSSSNPCDVCEGDCDSSTECVGDLECFFRSDLTPVPGCRGSGEFGGDYCYNISSALPGVTYPVTEAPSSQPSLTSQPSLKPQTPQPSPTAAPSDCADDPFEWVDGFGDGCDWYAINDRCQTFGDLCENLGFTANQACCVCGGGIKSKELTWLGWDGCSPSNPCGLCEGNCNSNLECAGNLECFMRGDLTPIPGCSGPGEFGGDYCYDSSSLSSVTLFPTPFPFSQPPSPQPTSSTPTALPSDCIDDPTGWVDSFGDGCDWYAIGNRCKKFGNSFQNNGFAAKDVCCVCDGGFTPPPIVDLGSSGCSFSNPCGLCEGDCNVDSDCEGDLQCFFRFDLTPVPGCSGSGVSGNDYCHRDPSNVIAAPTPKPTSRPTRMPSIAGVPHCKDDPIGWIDLDGRGCDWYGEKKNRCKIFGAGSINEGLNANKACCVCGGGSKYTFPPLKWEGLNGCSVLSPCGECEGNCNADEDCIDHLECFQRDGTETSIPGCSGSGVFDADYCYDPLMNQPPLNFRGWDACSPLTPCGMCEGDCDSDLDCAGSLSCHKQNSVTVPGCRGEAADGGDYCL